MLSDERIEEIAEDIYCSEGTRAEIEYSIRVALTEAVQVPVMGEAAGWICKNKGSRWFTESEDRRDIHISAGWEVTPLFEKPTTCITQAELERLRKDANAPSSVEWPKHWVDQHVEPKTLHKPVLVPLEVLIRTEFELTHSERGGDYDTKILGILRDIIAQAHAAIAAEGEKE